MSSAVPLAAFCAVMTAVAVGRLLVDDRWNRLDIGSALIVAGTTALASLWAALDAGWLTSIERGALAVGGVLFIVAGLAVLSSYWE